MKIMTAKYKGKCYACDVRIKVGDNIKWSAVSGTKHWDCSLAVAQQTEADKRGADSITQLGDFSAVYALFEIAAKGGKWPRITINADGYDFYLYVSGQSAMIPNVINVNTPHDGWYGRITMEGAWNQRHKEVDERMADALSKLAMDPVGTVAMYGRLSGKCCFCKKQLTDNPSVEAGYGPVCAKRWGLAWGGGKLLQPVTDGKVWGMTADGKYGPVTEMVTDPPPILNSFVQAENSAAVLHGCEYDGPSQSPETMALKKLKAEWNAADDDDQPCDYCNDTGKVANTEPGDDEVVCMGCLPKKYHQLTGLEWSPDAPPIDHPAGEPMQWDSEVPPKAAAALASKVFPDVSGGVKFGALAALITADAGTPPKETVTLKSTEVKFKVNLPDGYPS